MIKVSKFNELNANDQKMIKQQDQIVDTDSEKKLILDTIITLEKEVEIGKKEQEKDKKTIEELTRERDLLNKNLTAASKNTIKQIDLIKTHDQTIKHLEQEIENYKEEATKQRKLIRQVEKERDLYIYKTSKLTEKVFET